jgi:hypothetical protein
VDVSQHRHRCTWAGCCAYLETRERECAPWCASRSESMAVRDLPSCAAAASDVSFRRRVSSTSDCGAWQRREGRVRGEGARGAAKAQAEEVRTHRHGRVGEWRGVALAAHARHKLANVGSQRAAFRCCGMHVIAHRKQATLRVSRGIRRRGRRGRWRRWHVGAEFEHRGWRGCRRRSRSNRLRLKLRRQRRNRRRRCRRCHCKHGLRRLG